MIEKFETIITPFNSKRNVHVYLPNDYYTSGNRYPVMYMYDGHNLFYDTEATYGKSWGLKEFMDNYDKPLIIIGLECNHEGNERLNEYCPYDVEQGFLGPIVGRGKLLMDWLVAEFKPMIDRRYRTYPFRECTGIAGSSMGGLMALYTVLHYNIYFSKAACISPAIGLCQKDLKQELQENDISSDTRVYFSFGTQEIKNVDYMVKQINVFIEGFKRIGASSYLNVVNDGRHCEACWEKENPIYLNYLWK